MQNGNIVAFGKTSVSEDKFKNNQGILRHLENINSLVHQKQVFEMSRFEDQFSQYIDLAKDHLESFDIEEATNKRNDAEDVLQQIKSLQGCEDTDSKECVDLLSIYEDEIRLINQKIGEKK